MLVAAGWYAFRPERLFIDRVVAEDFPVVASRTTGASGELASMESMAESPSRTVTETMDTTEDPEPLLAGTFHSNAHETEGTATIYALDTGQRILRFTGFATSNGPDVRVYLVAASDVNEDGTVGSAGFVDLGALKGNIGDQNYEIPASADLARYRAVSIWCRRFSVNFGAAPLTPADG